MIEVQRLNNLEVAISLVDTGFVERPRFNLRNARVFFTVKEHLTDDESLVRIQKDNIGGGLEITDEDTGEILVSLTPGDLSLPPSDYYYDIFVMRDDMVHSCEPAIFRVKATVMGVLR